jgi:hypothetical protein
VSDTKPSFEERRDAASREYGIREYDEFCFSPRDKKHFSAGFTAGRTDTLCNLPLEILAVVDIAQGCSNHGCILRNNKQGTNSRCSCKADLAAAVERYQQFIAELGAE